MTMEIIFGKEQLNNKTVAVAVSGGMDSTCLLHYLNKIKSDYGFTLKAINIDHNMRENSNAESQFVVDFCDKLGVELKCFTAKKNSLKAEEDARIFRYECFRKCIDEGFCDMVATAHHKSDLIESVLLNVFRGTGISGLKGIKCVTENGIIRPMLYTKKAEIEGYCMRENVPYVVDDSNLKTDYNRNFLRLEIIPKLLTRYPDLEENVFRLSLIAGETDEFISSISSSLVSVCTDGKVKLLINENKTLFSYASIIAMKKAGIKKDYEKKHVDALTELAFHLKNGSKISLINGIIAIKEYDHILLYPNGSKTEKNDSEYIFDEGSFSFLDGTLKIELLPSPPSDLSTLITTDKTIHYADYDKIKNSTIRTRKDGDYFKAFSGNGKKLKDYFIDKKIPQLHRDDIPLIADGKNILYVGGKEISFDVFVDKTTDKVVQLTYIKNTKD